MTAVLAETPSAVSEGLVELAPLTEGAVNLICLGPVRIVDRQHILLRATSSLSAGGRTQASSRGIRSLTANDDAPTSR